MADFVPWPPGHSIRQMDVLVIETARLLSANQYSTNIICSEYKKTYDCVYCYIVCVHDLWHCLWSVDCLFESKKITSSHFAVFYFYKISRVVTFYTLIPVLRLCDYYLSGWLKDSSSIPLIFGSTEMWNFSIFQQLRNSQSLSHKRRPIISLPR